MTGVHICEYFDSLLPGSLLVSGAHSSPCPYPGTLLCMLPFSNAGVARYPDVSATRCAGMYADLDYEAIRNMDDLLQGHSVYVADMNSERKLIGSDAALQQLVPNAWMAGVPHHLFWLVCLQRVIRNAGYIQGYRDAEGHMGR